MTPTAVNNRSWAVWIPVALCVLAGLPGMMSGNFLPKTFWAALATAAGLALIPPFRPSRLSLSPLGLIWLLYLAWALLSLSWAYQPRVGLDRWLGLFLLTAAYLLARRCRFWRADGFWLIMAGIVGLVAGIGLLQYAFPSSFLNHWFQGTAVPRSTLGERNYASMYLLVTLPFIARSYFRERGGKAAAAGFSLFLGVVFILLARTRGAWVGALGGAGFLLLAGIIPRLRAYRRKILLLLLPGLFALAIAVFARSPSGAERSFGHKNSFLGTVSHLFDPRQRLEFWGPALGITNPWRGAGVGNFPIRWTIRGEKVVVKSLNYEVHNDYLQAYLDLGIPGAILFLLFTFTLLAQAWRSRKSGLVLAAGAAAAGLAVMQGTTFTSEKVSTLIWMAGVAAILNRSDGSPSLIDRKIPRGPALTVNYLLVGCLLLFTIIVGYAIRGDRAFRRREIQARNTLQLRQIASRPRDFPAAAVTRARRQLSILEREIRRGTTYLRREILPAIQFDMNMKHIYSHQFAEIARRLENFPAARDFARQALSLHPADRTARAHLARIALLQHRIPEGVELLEGGIETFGYAPDSFFCLFLIQLYDQAGLKSKAASVREKMEANRVSSPLHPVPADGATEVSLNPSFDWEDCGAARSYDFFLWKVGEDDPEYPTFSNLRASKLRLPKPLKTGITYLWRVRAEGRYEEKTSRIWVFRTER